jgi:hypothetical protein
MSFIEKVQEKLAPNTKAFTAILVGSIMAILIGSVMLVITYLVLASVITAIGTLTNAALNTSLYANITVITQALTITGVSLIVAGVAGIIYMLMGVAGMAGNTRGR